MDVGERLVDGGEYMDGGERLVDGGEYMDGGGKLVDGGKTCVVWQRRDNYAKNSKL